MRLRHHRDFLKVLTGETISDLGSQVSGLALPLAAALALGATPLEMAALRAADYLPRIAVGFVAGVWIDRLRRRPILIGTNLMRALLMLGVAVAAALGVLRIEWLYGVEVVMAVLGVVFGTAFAAYLPSLVPPPLLVGANGARATSSAATEVVGPGLSGVLVQAAGVPGAVALDALSFVASAFGFVAVRAPEPAPPPPEARRRLHVELGEGLGVLLGHPIQRALLISGVLAHFFYQAIMAVYVLYLARTLGLSPAALGVIFGLGGGSGLLVGSAVASRVADRLGVGPTLVLSRALFGVFGLLLGASLHVPAYAAVLVFGSELLQLGVNAVYSVNEVSLQQVVTPSRLRGRVASSRTVVHAATGLPGITVGGLLGEWYGPGATVWFGVLGGLFSFLGLLTGGIWRTRRLPAAAD